jgi:hypothetical protein
VVARAHGAELRLGEAGELSLGFEVRGADLFQHGVIDALASRDAHAEQYALRDFAHDRRDSAESVEIRAGQLGAGGLVAAADVISHA